MGPKSDVEVYADVRPALREIRHRDLDAHQLDQAKYETLSLVQW